jgi:hypothetical protein
MPRGQVVPDSERGVSARDVAGRLGALGPGLVVVLGATFALRRLDNTDTWWHLSGGRWIVRHGRIPWLDPLSYTAADHPWINVQWLYDVLLYGLHVLGGPSLLVVASMVAYTGAVALMVHTTRQRASPLVTTVLGSWAVLASQDRFAIRPEMASFLWLQAVLWIYVTGRRPASRRLWVLVPVMTLWANTHALFIVGVVVIAAHMGAALVGRFDRGVTRRVLASGAAAIAATAIGPFGVHGALFPLRLLARVRKDDPVFSTIGEFQPPFGSYFVTFSISLYRVLFVAAAATVLVTIAYAVATGAGGAEPSGRAARRRGRPAPPPERRAMPSLDLGGLAVFVGLAYLSLLARRNVALFAMGSAPFLASCVQVLADAVAMRFPRTGAVRRPLGVVVSMALVGTTWFVATNGYYRWNGELREFGLGVLEGAEFPVRGVAFAREQGLPPPLFNDFSNGGYLTWTEPVPGGVYIDGRTEVYDPEFFAHYTALLDDPQAWQAEADRRGIQTVFFLHRWPNHRTLAQWLLRDPRWALVCYDHTSIVLVRRAGNEALVARAEAALEPLRREAEGELLAPVDSWQWPVGRARAVARYGVLLDMMGRAPEAMRFYEHFLALGGSRQEEVGFALRLAQHHASTGARGLARDYLERAARLDPAAPGIARVRAQLDR